jgi:hypothetical protein
MSDLPIACTLDAAEMLQRGAEISALGRDGLEAVERGEGSVTLRFRPDPSVRERVEAIVAAESRCCAFLDFSIAEVEGATLLMIAGPEGAEPALHDLAALFSAEAAPVRVNPSPCRSPAGCVCR